MNISNVDVKLSGEDVKSIINDFVDVPGLDIQKVELNDKIRVLGEYKTVIKVPFMAEAEITKVYNNMVYINITNVKVFKLGIFKFIRNIALNVALKQAIEFGVKMENKEINIDLNTILKKFPFIKANLIGLKLQDNFIVANAESISLDISKFGQSSDTSEENKDEEAEENNEENNEENIDLSSIEKVDDYYSEGRKVAERKISNMMPGISEYVLIVPDIITLLYRLLRDNRVSKGDKAVIISAISYVALPVDIIPDFIPVIGKLDEISIVLFALNKILKDIPIEVIVENWDGKNDLILTLKKVLEYLKSYTKVESVENIYNFLNKIIVTV